MTTDSPLPYPIPPKAVKHAFDLTLKQYEHALEFLGDTGIRHHSQGRLQYYRDTLAFHTKQDPPISSTRALERLAFVLREIDEILQIVNGLSHPPEPLELQLLQETASGAAHPDDEKKTRARDFQYELWLLSHFRACGIPADLREPDLWITWAGRPYPVAAKRPGNRQRLDDRVDEGLYQLKEYTDGGLIAISLDRLLRPSGTVLAVDSPHEAMQVMDLLFLGLLKWLCSAKAPLTKRVPGKNAIAFLVTGSLPSFIHSVGTFSLENRRELLSVKEDERVGGLVGLREVLSSFVPIS